MNSFTHNELEILPGIVEALKKCGSVREKIETVDQHLKSDLPNFLHRILTTLDPECELIIKSLIVIGQSELLMFPNEERQLHHSICHQVGALVADSDCDPLSLEQKDWLEKLRFLLDDLIPVESFYSDMGGIIGYHWTMFSFLSKSAQLGSAEIGSRDLNTTYHRPPGIDISSESEAVETSILEGIKALPHCAEIYPVGGAADRLKFYDSITGQPLPAAKFIFNGHTLLEGMMRDLQSREYGYYQLFKEQITTPVAMMTSSEKDNHRHILDLCEMHGWFGRPKSSFRFFCQPLVPTMDKSGKWCVTGQMKLLMKPGGHGVIWKVAYEEGVFDWMQSQGRDKVLVRQINNPIAGIDYGLLAFCGIGVQKEKVFGFSSCPRQIQSAEGVNILLERKESGCSYYRLTNVEYCDFLKFHIEDIPAHQGSSYSQFPSNTNILFVDISAVKKMVTSCPIPGMLVNLKKIAFVDEEGNLQEREVARLESTMQNLADCFEQAEDSDLPYGELELQTYLTYHLRHKTISTIKRQFQPGESFLETPEGCYYDVLVNAYDLLKQHCGFCLPEVPEVESYLQRGPSFIFSYHPALGPLFSTIGKKLRGGVLNERSELRLEIAKVDIGNLNLTGSLHVIAEQVMGARGEDGILVYSEDVGHCHLSNVTIINRGGDFQGSYPYWKGEISRFELCEIIIFGDGEFHAENVTLSGAMRIEIESGTRVICYEEEGQLKFKKESSRR